MGVRGIIGVVLVLIGAVWVAQGTNVLKGSAMTGQGQWAVTGVAALVAGLALIGWDVLGRRRAR